MSKDIQDKLKQLNHNQYRENAYEIDVSNQYVFILYLLIIGMYVIQYGKISYASEAKDDPIEDVLFYSKADEVRKFICFNWND